MDPIALLLEEKKHRIQEMYEYNKRLDRTIVIYITAVYAAIGLKVTGKIELASYFQDPNLTIVAFLFIFLNFCILLLGISQSAWSISLAKFIHSSLHEEIGYLLTKTGQSPPENLNGWDDWTTDIKGLANLTRTYVFSFWILLVLGASIYSLRVVDIRQFSQQNPITTGISASILFFIQTLVFYLGILEFYLLTKFHFRSPSISPPSNRILAIAFAGSLLILCFCIFVVIK
jgi:hypothetical protein